MDEGVEDKRDPKGYVVEQAKADLKTRGDRLLALHEAGDFEGLAAEAFMITQVGATLSVHAALNIACRSKYTPATFSSDKAYIEYLLKVLLRIKVMLHWTRDDTFAEILGVTPDEFAVVVEDFGDEVKDAVETTSKKPMKPPKGKAFRQRTRRV